MRASESVGNAGQFIGGVGILDAEAGLELAWFLVEVLSEVLVKTPVAVACGYLKTVIPVRSSS
jgi:hypothetical protein